MLLTSAFSLNMLEELNANVSIRPIEIQDVRDLKEREGLTSAVGHADTAAVFETMLGFSVVCNRLSLELAPGDRIIVGQYRGPRLEAGTTELPQGAKIEWALVVIRKGR